MSKSQQQLDELIKRLGELSKKFEDGAVTNLLAKKTFKQVKKRTRAGFGITSDKPDASIVKLAIQPKTKKARKKKKKLGLLSNKTKPSKANLTETGHMIDDLELKRINKNEFLIETNSADQHKADNLALNGTYFLGLAKKELKSILKDSIKVFNKIFTKINNV